MAATAMTRITQCPPATAHQTESLDPYIFANRVSQPVAVQYAGLDKWRSTGLGFDETGSVKGGSEGNIHIQQRKQSGVRRLETPSWALNNKTTAAVILRFMECSAHPHYKATLYPGPGTDKERLQRCVDKLKSLKPRLLQIMDGLCHEYVTLKTSAHPDSDRLRVLEGEIRGIDKRILLIDGGPAFIAAVISNYYRARFDSVGVSQSLDGRVTPTHVRQILLRLNRIAAKIEAGEPAFPEHG